MVRRRFGADAIVIMAFVLSAEPAFGQAASRPVLHLQMFGPGLELLTVRKAIEGAWQRLNRAECQQVLTDFTDASGKSVGANLPAGRTAAEWLADLRFVDASHHKRCRSRDTVAFTEPEHRVIFLCGSHFANPYFSLQGTPGEMIVIHELLHTLGLRENPPASEEITRQVTKRCGPSRNPRSEAQLGSARIGSRLRP